MSNVKAGGLLALFIFLAFAMIGWTIFGYGVMIAAMLATEGLLQVLIGVYLVGSVTLLIVFSGVKAALR